MTTATASRTIDLTDRPTGRLMNPEVVQGGKRWYVVEQRMCGLLANGPFTSREEAVAALDAAKASVAA